MDDAAESRAARRAGSRADTGRGGDADDAAMVYCSRRCCLSCTSKRFGEVRTSGLEWTSFAARLVLCQSHVRLVTQAGAKTCPLSLGVAACTATRRQHEDFSGATQRRTSTVSSSFRREFFPRQLATRRPGAARSQGLAHGQSSVVRRRASNAQLFLSTSPVLHHHHHTYNTPSSLAHLRPLSVFTHCSRRPSRPAHTFTMLSSRLSRTVSPLNSMTRSIVN